MVDIRI